MTPCVRLKTSHTPKAPKPNKEKKKKASGCHAIWILLTKFTSLILQWNIMALLVFKALALSVQRASLGTAFVVRNALPPR